MKFGPFPMCVIVLKNTAPRLPAITKGGFAISSI